MTTTALTAPRVATGGRVLAPGWVQVDQGRVRDVGAGAPPPGAAVHELPDGWLAPGLVDLQLNGAYGSDFADASDDGWVDVLRRLPATGVTSVLPTVVTAPLDALADALRQHRRRRDQLAATAGTARVLGMHVEGPFLSARRAGAHRPALLCDPTPDRLAVLLDAGADGALTCLTLAPERDHAMDAVRRLTAAGVRVAVGHSDATDDVVTSAFDAGASLVTHLFNAQRGLHHRDPGVVGAALADPRCVCGLIVDLHHVAPAAVRVAFGAAPGRIALVTDAIAGMGMPPGTYDLGGESVQIDRDAPPRRADGTLAGSTLSMDRALANAAACGVDVADVIRAATRTPADALGRRDIGRIAPGATADLVWLDDDLEVRATWIDGAVCHRRDGADVPTLAGPETR